jgi:hypothetical protein
MIFRMLQSGSGIAIYYISEREQKIWPLEQ